MNYQHFKRDFPKKRGLARAWLPMQRFLLVFLLVSPGVLTAAQVQGLYDAEVEVSGQGAEQRSEAIQRALTKVLIKVTGNQRILGRKEAAKLLNKASQYVQQYRYRLAADHNETGTDAVQKRPADKAAAEIEQKDLRLLHVTFDPAAVNRALREQGLPVWGTTRPALLVWLAQENRGRRVFISAETAPDLLAEVSRAADARGLALLLPLHDLEDSAQLRVSDVWGGFEADLQTASRRYGPDMILTGRLMKQGNSWSGLWRLYHDARQFDWQTQNHSALVTAADGIHEAADRLAARFVSAASGGEMQQLVIRVEGLHDLDQYTRLTRYLEGIDMVEQVNPQRVDVAHTLLSLRVRGSAEALAQRIALGSMLEQMAPEPSPLPQPGSTTVVVPDYEPVDLQYRLRP